MMLIHFFESGYPPDCLRRSFFSLTVARRSATRGSSCVTCHVLSQAPQYKEMWSATPFMTRSVRTNPTRPHLMQGVSVTSAPCRCYSSSSLLLNFIAGNFGPLHQMWRHHVHRNHRSRLELLVSGRRAAGPSQEGQAGSSRRSAFGRRVIMMNYPCMLRRAFTAIPAGRSLRCYLSQSGSLSAELSSHRLCILRV